MPTQAQVTSFTTEALALLQVIRQRMEQAEVWVRIDSRIDLVVGSHITRALHTASAALVLAATGNHFDSSTLARTLIEHEVNLIHLYEQSDQASACDHFARAALSDIAGRHKALARHFPETFALDKVRLERLKMLAAATGYTGRYNNQVDRLTEVTTRFKATGFVRDVVYFDLSSYSHPRAKGLDSLAPLPLRPFTFQYEPSWDQCGVAAYVAIIYFFSSIVVAAHFWGLDIVEWLDNELIALADRHPDIGQGVYEGDDLLPDL